jgi:transcriptional regulator with XRE-family HTH domain
MEQQSMGKRIMFLRKDKGLTQEQLAERVGVSPQAVSKWENDASCPDITILPMLADVLGVTTDELLGVKPIQPRVIVVEKPNGNEQEQAKAEGVHFSNEDKRNGIIFAFLIILLGVAFLLNKTGVMPFNVWSIVWPAVILGVGISWCINGFSPLALGVGLLGLYYLLFNLGAITFVLTWSIVWPIALILLGLTILLDKIWPERHKKWRCAEECQGHVPVSNYNEADGYIRYDCSFSEENRKVTGNQFAGGKIDVSFGKSVLDLTGITNVVSGARLNADVSFGSFEILLPRTIRLQTASDKSFGSVQTKGEASADASMMIYLDGDVSFGSMVIRYI